MLSLTYPVLVLTTRLDDLYSAEALYFPEVQRLAGKAPVEPLLNSLKAWLASFPAQDWNRRVAPRSWDVRKHTLEIKPGRPNPTWSEPVDVDFYALHYRIADLEVAYFPALGIEVTDLEAIPTQVRSELMRSGRTADLGGLRELMRISGLEATRHEIAVDRLTLREQLRKTKPVASLLKKLTTQLLKTGRAAFGYERHLERMAEILSAQEGCRSLLLVGPSGVGKSAAVRELARAKDRYGLPGTLFAETSASRLIAGEGGYGGWQERCGNLITEWGAAKAILHLGSLVELLEVARHATEPFGMAGFFRPALARGTVQAICECTPEQLTYLERECPQLLESFTLYRLEPPNRQQTADILQQAFRKVDREVREEVLDLHERFSMHSASPGWEGRILTRLRQQHPHPTRTDLFRLFSAQSGLPEPFLDNRVPLDLPALREWFETRVRGQSEPVNRVVERLAAFKAALNRPGRPLCSMLLLGPTGTGKTELARCLAEYLFGDRTRLSRLDMSEFSDAWSVQRLIGLAGLERPGQLVSMVREKPFQVVLFDEVEKAHPDFFDLLLQVLGEGRLSDAQGNLADFTNCLILMTTNLGADSLQKGSLGLRARSQQGEFLKAVRATFRPELINRLDDMLAFEPLEPEIVEELAENELRLLQVRPGLEKRSVAWTLEAGVVGALARAGYDRLYGARPLKRACERQLAAPLAAQLCELSEEQPLEILVKADLKVQVRATHTLQTAQETARRRRGLGEEIATLRRRMRRFDQGPLVNELRNDKSRHLRKTPDKPWPLEGRLRDIEQLREKVDELEQDALLALEGYTELREHDLRDRCQANRKAVNESIVRLYCRTFENPDRVVVAFFGENSEKLRPLAQAYLSYALEQKYTVQAHLFRVRKGVEEKPTAENPNPFLERLELEKPELLMTRFPGLLALALELKGPQVHPRLALESGRHLLYGPDWETPVWVQVSERKLAEYWPPLGVHRQGGLTENLPNSLVRSYDLDRWQAHDPLLEAPVFCNFGGTLRIHEVLDRRLLKVAEEAALA